MSLTTKDLAYEAMVESIELREKWDREHNGPLDVYMLCKDMGIKVRFIDVASMEGIYGRREDGTAVIWLSSLRPLPRRNFNCAHELGHHVFCHGSTVDELVEGAGRTVQAFRPEEFLVNTFAGFLLMPTLGVRRAFACRGWDPQTATPVQIFTVACHFGVGYETLITHLAHSLKAIGLTRADELRKTDPKAIRHGLLGFPVSEPLVIADRHWGLPTLDAEVGTLLLLPEDAVAGGNVLDFQADYPSGRLFRAVRPGIARITCPSTPWAVFARVSPYQFVGFAEYRHLEQEDNND